MPARTYYGVLIPLSGSYPPVEGRLHTCYAPLRHSHIVLLQYLPFDLHVLGLPLAFILSQDQTLHCIVFQSQTCVLNLPRYSSRFRRIETSANVCLIPLFRLDLYRSNLMALDSFLFSEFDSRTHLCVRGSAINYHPFKERLDSTITSLLWFVHREDSFSNF